MTLVFRYEVSSEGNKFYEVLRSFDIIFLSLLLNFVSATAKGSTFSGSCLALKFFLG